MFPLLCCMHKSFSQTNYPLACSFSQPKYSRTTTKLEQILEIFNPTGHLLQFSFHVSQERKPLFHNIFSLSSTNIEYLRVWFILNSQLVPKKIPLLCFTSIVFTCFIHIVTFHFLHHTLNITRQPIRGQYSSHVILLDQSEASQSQQCPGDHRADHDDDQVTMRGPGGGAGVHQEVPHRVP